MKYPFARIYLALFLSLFSGFSIADSTHQFSLTLDTSKAEYDHTGEARSHSFAATAYFNPINKSVFLPHSRNAFYSQTGSLSISTNRTDRDGLNAVIRGKVLKEANSKQYSINTFLAYKAIPVWTKLSYQYIDEINFYYSDGTEEDVESELKPDTAISLGAYIDDHLSFYLTYSKQENKTYGAGIVKLFDLSNFGFLEANIEFSKTDRQHTEILLRNNIELRNSRLTMNEKNALFKFSYFPIPTTGFTLAYQQIGFDRDHLKNHYYSVDITHYLTNTVHVGIHYSHKDDDSYDWYQGGNYNDIGLSLGFDF